MTKKIVIENCRECPHIERIKRVCWHPENKDKSIPQNGIEEGCPLENE